MDSGTPFSVNFIGKGNGIQMHGDAFHGALGLRPMTSVPNREVDNRDMILMTQVHPAPWTRAGFVEVTSHQQPVANQLFQHTGPVFPTNPQQNIIQNAIQTQVPKAQVQPAPTMMIPSGFFGAVQLTHTNAGTVAQQIPNNFIQPQAQPIQQATVQREQTQVPSQEQVYLWV